jgi:ABC-type sulfate transport system substrate-binding protein
VAYHVQVIAMKKGNPKNITSITDLTRDGLKIALGDVNATAIGKATAKLLLSLHSSQERYVTNGISFSYLISFALRISPLTAVVPRGK